MNKLFLSIVIVVVVIAGLLTVQAMRQGTSSVFIPSELISAQRGAPLQRVRVAGKVSTESIDYQVDPKFRLSFTVTDPGNPNSTTKLPVVYNQIKPDMFAPGRDVILNGDYDGNMFIASSLLTQCPSKYEPPSPTEHSKNETQGEVK